MDDKSNAQQKIEKVYGIPNIKNVVPKIADGIGKQVDTSKRLMEIYSYVEERRRLAYEEFYKVTTVENHNAPAANEWTPIPEATRLEAEQEKFTVNKVLGKFTGKLGGK